MACLVESVYPDPMKNQIVINRLLAGLAALFPAAGLAKESVITEATAYVIRGEPINVEALAINEALSSQKPMTLLVWRSSSRRWVSVGSSHSTSELGFAKVAGKEVLFTYTETQTLDPGATYFGITRNCTANGICPLDVEPDAAVRVIIALDKGSE